MYASLLSFPGSFLGDFERLRRDLDTFFNDGAPASIRSVAAGSFPAVNVGHTPASVEVYAFAPGIDAASVDVTLDRGVLTIAGERRADAPQPEGEGAQAPTAHCRERSGGRFKRVVNLPDDIDPARVEASYRDGVLRISIARQQAAQPRRIAVQ